MSSTAGANIRSQATRGSISVEQPLLVAAVCSFFVFFIGLSLFLFVRRLGGAFTQPLGGFALVTASLVCGLAAAALRTGLTVRRLVSRGRHSVFSAYFSGGNRTLLFFSLAGITSILLLAAVTVPGTPAVGVLIAWFLLISAEVVSWLVFHRSRTSAVEPSLAPLAHPGIETPPGLQQQLTRVREHNRESIHALLRAEIPPDDRLATLHIAFCPPLAAPPALTGHAIDADDVEVKIAQAEKFGARIEVRVPRASNRGRAVLVEVLGAATSLECD